jgi:hypothetical protein
MKNERLTVSIAVLQQFPHRTLILMAAPVVDPVQLRPIGRVLTERAERQSPAATRCNPRLTTPDDFNRHSLQVHIKRATLNDPATGDTSTRGVNDRLQEN